MNDKIRWVLRNVIRWNCLYLWFYINCTYLKEINPKLSTAILIMHRFNSCKSEEMSRRDNITLHITSEPFWGVNYYEQFGQEKMDEKPKLPESMQIYILKLKSWLIACLRRGVVQFRIVMSARYDRYTERKNWVILT